MDAEPLVDAKGITLSSLDPMVVAQAQADAQAPQPGERLILKLDMRDLRAAAEAELRNSSTAPRNSRKRLTKLDDDEYIDIDSDNDEEYVSPKSTRRQCSDDADSDNTPLKKRNKKPPKPPKRSKSVTPPTASSAIASPPPTALFPPAVGSPTPTSGGIKTEVKAEAKPSDGNKGTEKSKKKTTARQRLQQKLKIQPSQLHLFGRRK